MFEEEVQRRVKDVATRHQSVLAKLFGEGWRLRDYSQSGAGSPPAFRCLGQKVVYKGSGEVFIYLCFERDEEGHSYFYPEALFWRERVTLLNRLWTSVEAIQAPKPGIDKSRIFLSGGVPSNDWASCEKELDAVVREWIKLWQKLGGLPKYLRRSAH